VIGTIVNYHIKMLYFIGLGLGDAKDITVKGLEIVKSCSRVYLVRAPVEL
jgi:precorrin-2 methylase